MVESFFFNKNVEEGLKMSIKKLELGWVTVSDFSKAKSFFVDTLGLEVFSGCDEYSWLELRGKDGGMILGVGGASEECGIKPGQNAVMTMTVDDLVAKKAELESKGVKFISDIQEVPHIVKMVMFVDLDGNKYQLVQNLEEHKVPTE